RFGPIISAPANCHSVDDQLHVAEKGLGVAIPSVVDLATAARLTMFKPVTGSRVEWIASRLSRAGAPSQRVPATGHRRQARRWRNPRQRVQIWLARGRNLRKARTQSRTIANATRDQLGSMT